MNDQRKSPALAGIPGFIETTDEAKFSTAASCTVTACALYAVRPLPRFRSSVEAIKEASPASKEGVHVAP